MSEAASARGLTHSPAARLFLAYLATAATFVAVDAVWLGLVARTFYADAIGHLMASEPNLIAAGLFYALLPAALVWFALTEAQDRDSLLEVAARGAMFGLVTYGTYDLTNWATLRDWPGVLAAVDMGWGTLLSALAATAGALVWSRTRGRR